MTPETRQLLTLMVAASGESADSITGKERRRPLPAVRWLIGAELVSRGHSVNQAAREIGLDHNTLRYGLDQLRLMPHNKSWHQEQVIAAEFRRLIDSE